MLTATFLICGTLFSFRYAVPILVPLGLVAVLVAFAVHADHDFVAAMNAAAWLAALHVGYLGGTVLMASVAARGRAKHRPWAWSWLSARTQL